MKMRAIQILALGLLAATAVSEGQQSSTAPSTAQNPSVAPGAQQTTPAKPTAPPQDPTATTSTTPAPPAAAKEDKSVNANQQSKAAGETKSGGQAQQSQLPQSDQGSGANVASLDTGGLSSAEMQQKIENALRSEPTLSGSNLTVNVTDDTINVTGTVASGKDRTTASRIVQSFGENRKVKEKINVSGVKK
jgi:outer membrane biosynthesis protein TonB